MKNRLILIDQSSLQHKAFYAFSELNFRGINTGVLYGFIKFLCDYLEWFGDSVKVVSCADAKPYFRSVIYNGYKKGRKSDDRKSRIMRESFKQVKRFLGLSGIPMMQQRGLEADDLIAILARNYKDEFDEIFVISSDTDLNQLLDQDNLFLVRGQSTNPSVYDKDSFFEEYPTLACCRVWYKVSAMSGGHNGLPGIKNIGIKKAIKWFSINSRKNLSSKDFENIKQNLSEVRKTYPLALLPFPGLHNSHKLRIAEVEKDEDELEIFLENFGISSVEGIKKSLRFVS